MCTFEQNALDGSNNFRWLFRMNCETMICVYVSTLQNDKQWKKQHSYIENCFFQKKRRNSNRENRETPFAATTATYLFSQIHFEYGNKNAKPIIAKAIWSIWMCFALILSEHTFDSNEIFNWSTLNRCRFLHRNYLLDIFIFSLGDIFHFTCKKMWLLCNILWRKHPICR